MKEQILRYVCVVVSLYLPKRVCANPVIVQISLFFIAQPREKTPNKSNGIPISVINSSLTSRLAKMKFCSLL